jgi:hypothetical protein
VSKPVTNICTINRRQIHFINESTTAKNQKTKKRDQINKETLKNIVKRSASEKTTMVLISNKKQTSENIAKSALINDTIKTNENIVRIALISDTDNEKKRNRSS